jgi:N-methylhydantoinase A/oxoprolinase/acetone carboxylase beta subunit
VWGDSPALSPRAGANDEPARATAPVVFAGDTLDAAVLRGDLPAGTGLSGPAVCALAESTLLVAPGWSGAVDEHGTVLLQDDSPGAVA